MIVFIDVEENDEITGDEDQNVEGRYTIELPNDSISIANCALDILHNHIPISVPGDFSFSVFDENETELYEDYKVSSYSTPNQGTVKNFQER